MLDGGIGEQLVRAGVVQGGPLEPEEEELGLERSRALLQLREQRSARGVGHVRREAKVRVGQPAVEGRLDALALRNRVRELGRVELADRAVIARAERLGRGLGAGDLLLELGIVGPFVQIGEVPRDLFRAGQLCRRHAPEPTGKVAFCR